MRGLVPGRRANADLIVVVVWIVVMVFLGYLYAIVGPGAIEPLHDYAVNNSAVQNQSLGGTVSNYQSVTLRYAPALLVVGSVALLLVYAVFRERYSGPGRPPI